MFIRKIIHNCKICNTVRFFIKRYTSNHVGLRPRRSLLYVPGTEDRKIQKASGLNADVVVLDCEDGVSLVKKDECRTNIQKLLPSLNFGHSESAIRINSIDTEFAADDLKSILNSDVLPAAIMIPKIEDVEQIKWFKDQVSHYFSPNSKQVLNEPLKVIGQTETPTGMMNLRDIMKEVVKENDYLKFEAFVFGSDDFLACIGATRTVAATELLFARQYFIMHIKGFGLQAIDMVDINFKELDGLRKQSEEGARMGFTGKQVIHPNQIAIVNEAFSPTQKQVEYAEELVKAYELHQQSGKGAFTFRNSMIDMPSVKQAINILNLTKYITS